MKLGIFGYVPPPTVGHPVAFLENVRKFKTSTPLMLYSDHNWPDTIRLKGSPEVHKNTRFPNGEPNKFAVPNACFFTGMRIAHMSGFTHVIVLEEDCRVGRDNWDLVMWEEYFGIGRPLIAAGTLAVYNPCNWNPEAERRWNALLRRNTKRNFPVATYGWKGAGQKDRSCVFPNGALAIYDMKWIAKLFDLDDSMKTAALETAWDMAVGFRLWDVFQEDAYDVTAYMDSVFSGYGNLVTTEEDRKAMLTSGQVVAVHQIKTDWQP